MKPNSSKRKVLEAASRLFYQKGFTGTSVRDIAEQADVNVSLISYYFKNKQGLLEYAVTHYYEAYLETIKHTLENMKEQSPVVKLNEIINVIIHYKQTHHQLSCLIHRELSLDSVFVREVSVTYLAKENYYIRNAFYDILPDHLRNKYEREFLYLQLKGMIAAPFVLQNERRDKALDQYSNELFANQYSRTIHRWITHLAAETKKK
ncbi:putative HTH-type transcriptional regulator YttP [Lentibacillus sp. JNUCC-1]|uniref:forespore capture DNA-binding protein RefZ n=1 Tax=Lentibacillus sp. JNUCC-1 TaxID=2654513 RepID=UPI0013256F3E|nr:putative HTH-type transcriptional regulator YttP [Lentibacillus sp. JNUCC-1]